MRKLKQNKIANFLRVVKKAVKFMGTNVCPEMNALV